MMNGGLAATLGALTGTCALFVVGFVCTSQSPEGKGLAPVAGLVMAAGGAVIGALAGFLLSRILRKK